MNFNNISFILHKPQLSENIGLCARAMKNFGFNNLSVIEPKPIFPNDKIIATSVGAKDIIKQTKVFTNLEKSLTKTDIKTIIGIKTNIIYFEVIIGLYNPYTRGIM